MPPTARQRLAQQPPLPRALSVLALSSRAFQRSGKRLRIPPNWIFAYLRNITVTPIADCLRGFAAGQSILDWQLPGRITVNTSIMHR